MRHFWHAVSASGSRASNSSSVAFSVVAVPRAEELLDVGVVARARRGDLLEAGLRQGGIGHAGVARAALLLDPAGPLEPVQEPRDARGGEEDGAREVDPPQPVALGVEELDEDVEVAERQPVRVLEARRELPRHRGVGPQEAEPGRLR